MTIFRDLSQGY